MATTPLHSDHTPPPTGRSLTRHPLFGGLMLNLATEAAEQRWEPGARSDPRVVETLDACCDEGAHLLQDLRIPGVASTIRHIAVAPSGVWVIASASHPGRVEVRRPLFGDPQLRVGGRDATALVTALGAQAAAVALAVHEALPDVRVRGALCLCDSELPLRGTLGIDGLLVVRRQALARRICARGSLRPAEARALVAVLRSRYAA